VLRVVSGSPTAEELAVLAALVAAASAGGGDEPAADRGRRGRWNDPAAAHRRPLLPGPNGWRAAGFG
jgi:hypothetical protein